MFFARSASGNAIVLFTDLLVLPLAVYLPFYLYRLMRRPAGTKMDHKRIGRTALIFLLYIWVFTTYAAIVLVDPSFILFPLDLRSLPAVRNLNAISRLQADYFEVNHHFAGQKSGNDAGVFAGLGWKPEPNDKYAYYLGDDIIGPTRPGSRLRFRPDAEWPFLIRPGISENHFTAMAIGNLDRDGCPDAWMINDDGKLRQVVDDTLDWHLGNVSQKYPWERNVSIIENIMQKYQMHPAYNWVLRFTPAMLIVIPILYYLLLRERRKWREAVEEARAGADAIKDLEGMRGEG